LLSDFSNGTSNAVSINGLKQVPIELAKLGEAVKNRTIIPVFREAIEIVSSSASTNYTFVIGVQTFPQTADPLLTVILARTRCSR
jgi:hypothetical protein